MLFPLECNCEGLESKMVPLESDGPAGDVRHAHTGGPGQALLDLSLGGCERLLDVQRFAAADDVPGDNSEVVRGFSLEAQDLSGKLTGGAHLLPGLLTDLLPLHDILLYLGPAVRLRLNPLNAESVLGLPGDLHRSAGWRRFV